MISDLVSILMQVLVILDIFFAAVIVFLERKNPAVTWAWLMVVLILPYVGFILYLTFGMEGSKHNTFIRKSKQDDKLFDSYLEMDMNKDTLMSGQNERIAQRNVLEIPHSEHLNDLVYLNFKSGQGLFTTNNEIQLFHDGNHKFDSLLDDIRRAKSFIHIQYYIFRNDELGRAVIAALAEKASQGVEVKLLIDGVGNMGNPKKLYRPLTKARGQLGIFLPPHFVRINYRNHRKICVIDGETGYIGGFNIGNEYIGKSKKFGNWRDCHIRIQGDAVKELELRFVMDWNYSQLFHKVGLTNRYFPPLPDRNGVSMQIVSSGPDTKWPSIHDGYIKMITEADKSIFIQSPYFVPDDSIFEMLRIAALSGIDVRIMIPGKPDHPFVYWAALSYLEELAKAGVKCYQYENGFVHSKLVMIDSLVTSIGTANMDIRSFKLNFEVNAFIYSEEKTMAFEAQFLKDIEDCTPLDVEFFRTRSNLSKIKESVSRLISPLL